MAGERDEKDLALERIEVDVGAGCHRRRARHVVQQCDLAETVTAVQRRDVVSRCNDVDLAVGDHVEAVAVLALSDHVGPGRQRERFERACK